MTGRILQAQKLATSFDPYQDARPARAGRTKPLPADAIEAGGKEQFCRFVRVDGDRRWDKLTDRRRQVWIDDFAAGLAAFSAAGGRI